MNMYDERERERENELKLVYADFRIYLIIYDFFFSFFEEKVMKEGSGS